MLKIIFNSKIINLTIKKNTSRESGLQLESVCPCVAISASAISASVHHFINFNKMDIFTLVRFHRADCTYTIVKTIFTSFVSILSIRVLFTNT